MAPVFSIILNNLTTHLHSRRSGSGSISSHWLNPKDFLALFTIIGGETVQRAVAQLSGHPSYVTPVAFSFGCLGYAINLSMNLALLQQGRFMPPPDCECIIVNAQSRCIMENRSWILGRLVRDHRQHEKHPGGLTVTFYKTTKNDDNGRIQGVPTLDWVYYSGIFVILLQLGIAVIPGAVDKDWRVFVVTAGGTMLSLLSGALPKWRAEKWNGRRSYKDSDRTVVCLTRGSGYDDVIVIISEGKDQYRLEDIARTRYAPVAGTTAFTLILCIAEILLVTILAAIDEHEWFMLGIGALGIVQNAVAAGIRRDLGTTGIHLEEVGFPITDRKVMKTLQLAEEREPYVGIALVSIFFPGGLRPDEEAWRTDTLARYKEGRL
ncbi:hypothetical protein QCA50_008058 [Cerrena zonata]|uniref:Uncharacterized protein n=1 Tax=Cerrena zonata TaxID=2478898 RepID=A0AAW0GBK0_9APHY